jgi:hypothetical protein
MQTLVADAATSSHSCAVTVKHCLKYWLELQNAVGIAVVTEYIQSDFLTSTAYELNDSDNISTQNIALIIIIFLVELTTM